MEINEIPRGQLSTIILTSLLDGDKYGYEIIQTVEEKTQGELVIKKPSLYSSLTRMEAQELVSSYWKESDIGGRRHYYRLTDYGRKQVLQWQEDLKKSQVHVSKVIEEKDLKPTILQQENLFSALKETQSEKIEQKITENKTENYIQYDLFSTNNFVANPDTSFQSAPTVFNAKMFNGENKENNDNILENQTNAFEELLKSTPSNNDKSNNEDSFNIDDEFSSYIKQGKSYSDEMKNQELQKNEHFFSLQKSALNENSISNDYLQDNNSFVYHEQNFDGYLDHDYNIESDENTANNKNANQELEEKVLEEKKDDAVFITETPNEDEMPKVKKIEPASFSHLDTSPTVAKKEDIPENSKQQISSSVYFNNYDELKKYYEKDKITLQTYSNFTNLDNCKIQKNEIFINKFNFLQTLILTILIFAESAISFVVLRHYNLISLSYLYFYLSVMVVFACPFVYSLIKYCENKYRKINISDMKQTSLLAKIFLLVVGAGIIFAFNLLFGMTKDNFINYISTTIYPCIILLDFVIIHIFKKIYVLSLNKKEQ